MKFTLVEDVLNENQWYEVTFDGTNPDTKYPFTSKVYVNAKDATKHKKGWNQAKNFVKSASGGKTHKDEQQFDSIVVNKLKDYAPTNLKAKALPKGEEPPLGANILSKNDISFRKEADNVLNNDLPGYIASLPKGEFKNALSTHCHGKKFFKHHLDGYERNNELSNMFIIPYNENDEEQLALANAAHVITHSKIDDVGNLKFTKGEIPMYDLRSKRMYTFKYVITK